MLKTYLKDHGVRTSQLARAIGVPYSTVNDLVNARTDIYQMRFGTVAAIAAYLNVSTEELCSLCRPAEQEALPSDVFVKNKCYYLAHSAGGRSTEVRLCKVSPLNTSYIKHMAAWERERLEQKERFDTWTLPTT